MSDFHISNILHPHVSHQNLFKCGYLSRRAWWREIWQLRGHVVACVDGSCLLIQGAVLKSNRSPWIARPRAHPARTYDSGGDTTAGLDIQLQHPGLIWSDRPLVLDLGESMNEVIHQPPVWEASSGGIWTRGYHRASVTCLCPHPEEKMCLNWFSHHQLSGPRLPLMTERSRSLHFFRHFAGYIPEEIDEMRILRLFVDLVCKLSFGEINIIKLHLIWMKINEEISVSGSTGGGKALGGLKFTESN